MAAAIGLRLAQRGRLGGGDIAGADAVALDVSSAVLGADVPGQHLQAALGAGVGRNGLPTQLAHHGADIDDLTVALAQHAGNDRFCAKERSHQVNIDDLPEILRRPVRHGDPLDDAGVESVLFAAVTANPMASIVRQGADLAAETGCDLVIGLGGGSAMDTAKGIAFLTGKEGGIFDYITGQRSGTTALPIICITTTAGTGSEGNATAVFTNDETLDKKGLVNPLIYPKVSFIDSELMAGLPRALIAGPGCDALFHAFESYLSKDRTPISEMYSLEAMRLSLENLPRVYHDPTDYDAWDKVILANTLAGMAIGCAGTTVPHALGQPVSGLLNVAHSDSLVCLYPAFMCFTAQAAPERFAKLAELLGCDISGKTAEEAADMSIGAMTEFLKGIDADKKLSQFGVREEHIDRLAESATTIMKVVLNKNPIVPTLEQVKQLYRDSL